MSPFVTYLDTRALKDHVEPCCTELSLEVTLEDLCCLETLVSADPLPAREDDDLVRPPCLLGKFELGLVNVDRHNPGRSHRPCDRTREQSDGAATEDEHRRAGLRSLRTTGRLEDDRQRLSQGGELVRESLGHPRGDKPGEWRSWSVRRIHGGCARAGGGR